MQLKAEGIASSLPRGAARWTLDGRTVEAGRRRSPARRRPAGATGALHHLAHGVQRLVGGLLRFVAHPAEVQRMLVAVLGACAIGFLVHGAWTLITWTPLPPLQFAASLKDVPPSQRDAVCTGLAVRKTAGPYDASMLAYAFDPAAGRCVAIEEDDFRATVMAARVRHQQLAWVLAVLSALGGFLWLLLRPGAPLLLPGASMNS